MTEEYFEQVIFKVWLLLAHYLSHTFLGPFLVCDQNCGTVVVPSVCRLQTRSLVGWVGLYWANGGGLKRAGDKVTVSRRCISILTRFALFSWYTLVTFCSRPLWTGCIIVGKIPRIGKYKQRRVMSDNFGAILCLVTNRIAINTTQYLPLLISWWVALSHLWPVN